MHTCNHNVSDHCDNLGYVKGFFLHKEHRKVIGEEAVQKHIDNLASIQEAMMLIEEAAKLLN